MHSAKENENTFGVFIFLCTLYISRMVCFASQCDKMPAILPAAQWDLGISQFSLPPGRLPELGKQKISTVSGQFGQGTQPQMEFRATLSFTHICLQGESPG